MKILSALLLGVPLSFCLNAQLPVNLGSTVSFGALAGSTVTNTGPTVLVGNLGVSPNSAVTGFGPGIVIGGAIHAADAVAEQAQSDLTAAYNDAAGRPCPGPPLLGNIGETTILPGVYCSSSSVGLTGNVTLNGNGNPNAVFIFQIGSTLTTAAGNGTVTLIGGAQASNVFWQVGSSATLGTNTTLSGTVMAQASVTLNTGAVLNGRALARTGAVTLASNSVIAPSAPGSPSVLSLKCSYPSGSMSQSYVSSLLAVGGIPPYNYSITAGTLPNGLALNPLSGLISGMPLASGPFSDTSRVVDSTGAFAASSCGITIAPAGSSVLSLMCASNAAQVGQPYLSSLAASGGSSPYTYSISAGSLPAGLALDPATGAISGTPTSAGSFSYTSRVVDATSASATSNCGPAIVVTMPPPPIIPEPSSIILIGVGIGCVALYQNRERLRRRFQKS